VRTAIISDIHANLSALETVLAHIDARGADRIVCLGDIVGYGPEPAECVDIVAKRCEWSLMGNHDCAMLYEPTNFNEAAKRAAYWTRQQVLERSDAVGPDRDRRLEFIMTLPVRRSFDDFICVHGTPRKCINEYLFPDDAISLPSKLQQIFQFVPRYCMVGHTHVPGVFSDEPDFYPPNDLGGVYVLRPDEKVIVNPGSVGQPRDGDPRASYAVLETLTDPDGRVVNRIEFHRVEYDVRRTVDRIHAIPELSNWLGDRLLEGR